MPDKIKNYPVYRIDFSFPLYWISMGNNHTHISRSIFVASLIFVFGITVYWVFIRTFQTFAPTTKLVPYYNTEVLEIPPDVAQNNRKVIVYQPAYKIPIIMYHYVEYIEDKNDTIRKSLTIAPNVFEAQLKTLQENGYTTYFVADIPHILTGSVDYHEKNIVLTFDDGYKDFYYDVYPLLQKYHIKATVYVITNFLGRKDFLTAAQVVELSKSPYVEIGSHTINHIYLKGARSDIAKTEIVQSKQMLEELTGEKITTFAYPYGAFDQSSLIETQEASYSAAVSVILGMHQSLTNEYYLSRIRAGSLGSGQYMINFLTSYEPTPTLELLQVK